MNETFRLGTIAGVRVGVNWSVAVIVALIVFGLAGLQFPSAYPGHSGLVYFGVALAAALVFVLSLLAHELSHAVIARRNGLGVEGITLWLLGGVAKLSGEAPNPSAELRIAGVGPLVSLLLGGLFAGIGVGLRAVGIHGIFIGAVGWLAAINILLAVFNIIPAAPLDGGRVLRSVVWWRTGDRLRATIRAAQAGRGFGWVLIGLGVLSFLTGRLPGGLWLALIGWFLISAANAEGRQASMRVALAGVPVQRIMTPDPATVPATMRLSDFLADESLTHRHSAYPVTDDAGTVVGLVTRRRIAGVEPEERQLMTLQQAACPIKDIATTSPNESVSDMLPRLDGCTEGRALVFTDGRLAGIVSPSDVTRALRWTDVSQTGSYGR